MENQCEYLRPMTFITEESIFNNIRSKNKNEHNVKCLKILYCLIRNCKTCAVWVHYNCALYQ